MSDRQVSMIATLIYVHFHHLRLQIVLYTNNQVPRRGRVGPACDCTGCGFCSLSNSSGSSTYKFSLASSSWSLLQSLQPTLLYSVAAQQAHSLEQNNPACLQLQADYRPVQCCKPLLHLQATDWIRDSIWVDRMGWKPLEALLQPTRSG